jgi:hypothetical protein
LDLEESPVDWSNERYVRLYVRDTKTWLLVGWEGQCLLPLILRKVDRAGIIDDVTDASDLAVILANGIPLEIVEKGLGRLLEKGVLELTEIGLVVPNFIEAQEAAASDKARARKAREVRRARARLDSFESSHFVTDPSQFVSPESQVVTERHATPSYADHTKSDIDDTTSLSLSREASSPDGQQRSLLDSPDPSKHSVPTIEGSKRRRQTKVKRTAKGTPTWTAYSAAYTERYGHGPVRNAKANSLCVQLVDALGADEAPKIAAYYVTINSNPYAHSAHTLALLVRDHQKIRTEWLSGRRITRHGSNEGDRLQETGDSWGRVIQRRGEK